MLTTILTCMEMAKIVAVLKESFQVPSPGVDPSMFTIVKPGPSEQNVPNNGDQLPMLFIYLLNQFSKAVVAQFVDEAGVSPRAAEPIGIVVASIFSNPELCWRGHSMIDILMAKMRVVCPVLWGIRGSEKTEQGRARLGWKKHDGEWVPEQLHNTRMTGLGAGYAAISLRDFSKSRFQNPWPPWHYWQSMASITSTPPSEASPTQYMVLKAMVENYEQRFFNFYGNAALAALRVALVDFPNRALEQGPACSALAVLADKLKRDKGLDLRS
jgi:nucleoporin GLE1